MPLTRATVLALHEQHANLANVYVVKSETESTGKSSASFGYTRMPSPYARPHSLPFMTGGWYNTTSVLVCTEEVLTVNWMANVSK